MKKCYQAPATGIKNCIVCNAILYFGCVDPAGVQRTFSAPKYQLLCSSGCFMFTLARQHTVPCGFRASLGNLNHMLVH